MRKVKLFLLAIALMFAAPCYAQFEGGPNQNTSDGLVVENSGTAAATSLVYPNTSPLLNKLTGVIQIVINSASACSTIVAPSSFTLVPNSIASGTGLCQALYTRTFDNTDGFNS